MNRVKLVLFALAIFLLAVPVSSFAGEICPADTAVTSATAPTVAAAAPPAAPALDQFLFDPAAAVPGPQPMTGFCTKEVCSAARQECRNGCLPCGFQFGLCNYPSCTGSCWCVC